MARVYPNLNAYMKDHPDETTTALAQELGISKGALSMFRWRHRQPGLHLALKMCARFNIPLESLITQKKKKARAA